MKYLFLLIVSFGLVSNCSFAQEFNVMTFNIRLNLASDSLNAWPYRKDKVSAQVLYHNADILGVQEALHIQMLDLQNALTTYSYVGGGRDDGKTKGEYSAIFYKKDRFTLLASSTFWLSESPSSVGGKGWDAAFPRVVTWGKLKDKKTKKIFFIFNTHFDHMGKIARRESAKLLLRAVDSIAGKITAVITGDFNAHPADEPIQVITNVSDPSHLTDTKALSVMPHYGPTGTFNGFGPKEVSDEPIDYIFFTRKVKVLEHATISQSWMGRYASDHFAVIAKLRLL